MFGGKKTGDHRVSRILDSEDIKYEIDSDGDFKIVVDLGEGRSQLAFINSNTEIFAGVEIREIWSIGLVGDGQLSAEVANSLLLRNRTYKVGGWEIAQGDGKVRAIFKVCLSADATPSELMAVLGIVLRVADQVEKEYLGTDTL